MRRRIEPLQVFFPVIFNRVRTTANPIILSINYLRSTSHDYNKIELFFVYLLLKPQKVLSHFVAEAKKYSKCSPD